MWRMSKAYSCRASELLSIECPLAAFYFDRATAAFGTKVDMEIDEARESAKSPQQKAMRVATVMQRRIGTAQFARV
jgi:hypothetical protein